MIFALYRAKVHIYTPFLRDIRSMFAHVLNVSLPSLLRVGFFVFGFFFAGHVGSLKTQISQKLQKPKYLAKIKKTKNPIRKMLGRGTLNACEKIQGLSQKRRGH